MYLKLTNPYNPGQNDPGQTYPCLYITQLTDSRPSSSFQFIYEAGNFVKMEDGTVTWVRGPGMLSQIATVDGQDYIDATKAGDIQSSDSAYQSIYRILYTKLIGAGFAGTIVDV